MEWMVKGEKKEGGGGEGSKRKGEKGGRGGRDERIGEKRPCRIDNVGSLHVHAALTP